MLERAEIAAIPLPDGDGLSVECYPSQAARSPEPPVAVTVFHGLGGHARADYMQRTALVARARGWPVILANHRGCGAGAGLARLPYHSGRAEDLAAVIAFSRARFPGARQLAVGFSLSGNALLLLVGGLRGDHRPDLAVAVNAPLDLERTSHALHRGLNRVYETRFVLDCRGQIAAGDRGRYRIEPWRTLRDFDAIYTAPASGFAGRDEYYSTCSSIRAAARIDVPTVVLTAADDPFVPVEDYRRAPWSPHVRLHVEPHGGHMGYLTRHPTPLGTRRWLDYALARAFDALAGS